MTRLTAGDADRARLREVLGRVSLTLSAAEGMLAPAERTEMDWSNLAVSVRAMLGGILREVDEELK